MTNIDGVQPVSAARAIQPTDAIPAAAGQAGLDGISDVVEISTASMLAAKIHEMPEIRADLVARVKAEIAAGAYDSEERLAVAVERIMDELLPES